jgi:uncharacterized protein
MSNLSDKLKSLGVKVGVSDIPKPIPRSENTIENVVKGSFYETPQGRIFISHTYYKSDYRQGNSSLPVSTPLTTLAEWIKDARLVNLPMGSIGFLDTETTGLAGGTGTYAFLVGAGRFEGYQFHLAQIFMTDPSEEPALLYSLEEFLAPCQATVTFNGKSFDLPLLRSRFAMNGFMDPFIEYIQIDLLHVSRRIWRDRLSSKSLGNIEAQILEARRTEDDVPGWIIPQLYFDYLRNGDAAPLKNVFYHNSMDVVSMAALLNHFARLLNDIENPDFMPEEQLAIAKLYYDLGHLDHASHIYQHVLETNRSGSQPLADQIKIDALCRLARIYKESGNMANARDLWIEAATLNDPYACIELAKLNEHHLKNLPEAKHWTEFALEAINSVGLDHHEKEQLTLELNHRLNRLERKTDSSHHDLS